MQRLNAARWREDARRFGYRVKIAACEEPERVKKNTEVDHSVAIAIAAICGGAVLAVPYVGITPLLVTVTGVGTAFAIVRSATKRIEKVERRRKERR